MSATLQLASFCVEEADRLAQASGFISVSSLASRFNVEVTPRPLLVEASIASLKQTAADGVESVKWLVLVDSERFAISREQVESESETSPLPGRLRNTIAHELLHSLSFRDEGTRFRLLTKPRAAEKPDEFVRRIERETERLSPLLLVPNSTLVELSSNPTLDLPSLLKVKARCAISREVLVSRLSLLTLVDPASIRYNTCLDDVAVGRGEWLSANKARLHGWPMYSNFRNGEPTLLRKLKAGNGLDWSLIHQDPRFYLDGGTSDMVDIDPEENAGIPPSARRSLRLTVEKVRREAKGGFLFILSRSLEGNSIASPVSWSAAQEDTPGQLDLSL